MITYEVVKFGRYGKCLQIQNGKMEMLVTLDLGPRIIKFNLIDKENLMFNDVDREISLDVSGVFGEGKRWFIEGGHRLWCSPEEFPITYYPDCENVEYKISDDGVEFIAPKQKNTGLKFSLKISFAEEEASAKMKFKMKNYGEDKDCALWALSVLDKNGTVVAPLSTEDTGLLANRNIVFWPYAKLDDPRFVFKDDFVAVTQNSNVPGNFKIGFANREGLVACQNFGQLFVKEFEHWDNANYPDMDCSCEIYTSEHFIEMETLSQMKKLKKDEKIVMQETWKLFEYNSNNPSEIIEKIK